MPSMYSVYINVEENDEDNHIHNDLCLNVLLKQFDTEEEAVAFVKELAPKREDI